MRPYEKEDGQRSERPLWPVLVLVDTRTVGAKKEKQQGGVEDEQAQKKMEGQTTSVVKLAKYRNKIRIQTLLDYPKKGANWGKNKGKRVVEWGKSNPFKTTLGISIVGSAATVWGADVAKARRRKKK